MMRAAAAASAAMNNTNNPVNSRSDPLASGGLVGFSIKFANLPKGASGQSDRVSNSHEVLWKDYRVDGKGRARVQSEE
jgi:hypothetical protein